MLRNALVSAEVSLPERPETERVRERISVLAEVVDVVGLTDNHAARARMSPLAAVALAREQGVATIVHVSCRDRNRLALRSQIVGAAALGSEGALCLQGDPASSVPRVKDMTATALIGKAREWAEPHDLEVGAVVNPFAVDLDKELRLLERKVTAGARFLQSQMVFDLDRLATFLDQASDLLAGVRFYAGVALLRGAAMADRASTLPGVDIPRRSRDRIIAGEGMVLATELASELAAVPGVDALHVFPLGAERETVEVAASFRERLQ